MNFRVVVAIAALGAFGSAGAGSALAQAPPAPDPGQRVALPELGPSIAPLPGKPGAASRQVTRHAGHPCYGQTDDPHNSSHYPGNALVSSRTVCAPHGVTITVDLYRFLFGGWYFLDRGGPASGVGTIQRSARWRCPNGSRQRFLGVGYHSATSHVSTSTSNERTFTCS
jgi:hypothetical protein